MSNRIKPYLRSKSKNPDILIIPPGQETSMSFRSKDPKDVQASHVSVAQQVSNFSNIQCPCCLRNFNKKAADRHIEFCQKKEKMEKF